MKTSKFTGVFILSIISFTLFSCKTKSIILHSDITGLVTDASNDEPIQGASVKLSQSNDTVQTGSAGIYLLKNLVPRKEKYEVQASKSGYVRGTKDVEVAEAITKNVDFSLDPLPKISVSFLDFGLDLTSLSFTISYNSKTKLSYLLTTSQDWLTLSTFSGDVTNETDTIKVTINKNRFVCNSI